MGHIFNNGFGGKMPGLVFQGNNGAYGGHGFNVDTGYTPWNQSNPAYLLRDDASKVFGKHSLQFGFAATLVQQNETSAVSGANSGDLQGLLTFSNQQSRYTTGNAFADFLAGPASSAWPPTQAESDLEPATSDYSGTRSRASPRTAAQADTTTATSGRDVPAGRLEDHQPPTLNLGFRGSFFGAWYNPNSTAYNWEPQAYSQSLGLPSISTPTTGNWCGLPAAAAPARAVCLPCR